MEFVNIGEHILYRGDCLDVIPSLSISPDLILVDPPYGTTQCKWDSVIPLELMWKAIDFLSQPTTPTCIFGAEPFSSKLRVSNINNFKYDWVWRKNKSTGFLNAKKQPLRNIETISVFYKKQCGYFPQKTLGHKPVNSFTKNTSDGDTLGATKRGFSGGGQRDRYPTSCLTFPVVNNDGSGDGKYHPTQKPVSLLEYLIRTYTKKGDAVLDFTMGSGSTGVACVNTGRKFIGIEKDDPEKGDCYFRVAEQRIKDAIDN